MPVTSSPIPHLERNEEYARIVTTAIPVKARTTGSKANCTTKYAPTAVPTDKKSRPSERTPLGVSKFEGSMVLQPLNGVGVVARSIPEFKWKSSLRTFTLEC